MKIGAILVALALAACVPMQWARPGASLAEMGRDQDECRRAALDQAWREENLAFFSRPYTRWDRERHYRPSPLGRMMREDDLSSFCMRVKGYRLQPLAGAGQNPYTAPDEGKTGKEGADP